MFTKNLRDLFLGRRKASLFSVMMGGRFMSGSVDVQGDLVTAFFNVIQIIGLLAFVIVFLEVFIAEVVYFIGAAVSVIAWYTVCRIFSSLIHSINAKVYR